jgi:hypothetical protein
MIHESKADWLLRIAPEARRLNEEARAEALAWFGLTPALRFPQHNRDGSAPKKPLPVNK